MISVDKPDSSVSVLFHDFPRNQIRAAINITGSNQNETTIPWPHVEKPRDMGMKNKIFVALRDFHGPSVLIPLLLMKC